MPSVPVGLQLFSVRAEVQKDLPATLKAIKDIGYEAGEPWGYDGSEPKWMGHTPAALRDMFADAGLKCCGMHLATDALVGANLSRTIKLNQTLGNRFLIIAADKTRMSSMEGIEELAKILNDTAKVLAKEDMLTGYHAHGFDFEFVGDITAWEHLFGMTDDDVVMQMDIGNCASGDGDPIAMLRMFPGRARSVHLKEYGKEGAVIGEGDMDWDTIFQVIDTLHKSEWFVVEDCPPEGRGFEVARRAFQALREMDRA